jgi:hypothetical protein
MRTGVALRGRQQAREMLEDVGWTKEGGASQARRERQHADCVTGLRAGIQSESLGRHIGW